MGSNCPEGTICTMQWVGFVGVWCTGTWERVLNIVSRASKTFKTQVPEFKHAGWYFRLCGRVRLCSFAHPPKGNEGRAGE